MLIAAHPPAGRFVVDHVSANKRSEIMRAVRTKHTGPELLVRKVAHGLGLRYRLHVADLPGKPDLVFPKWKTVIFVNGCFWHRHNDCRLATFPKTNRAFWKRKFSRNVQRDEENVSYLVTLGWRVIVIWQCEAKNSQGVEKVLRNHFRRPKRPQN